MLVSCLCVCHAKPDLAREAIESIVHQSYAQWEAIVMDSGVLADASYYDRFDWHADPRVKIVRSGETEETRRSKAMAPWCFNECFRRGLVTGDLVMYLCDDDLLYPNAFATFVSFCRRHPEAQAMYASQDIGVIYPNGWRLVLGERRATEPGGRSCHGRKMDGEVDYLQLCHKAELLKRFPTDSYWPEDKASESHADGIFMERLGELTTILPIDVKVSQNRRTPQSTYTPFRSLTQIDRILRREDGALLATERGGDVRTALEICEQRLEQLERENATLAGENRTLREQRNWLRYRIADRLHALCGRVPYLNTCVKRLLRVCGFGRSGAARRTFPPPHTR
jgi:hypothetical protein